MTGNVDGNGGDGVQIAGDGNTVDVTGFVEGSADGVQIDGARNLVDVGGNVTGAAGDGVDIAGDDNDVIVGGDISGDPGVLISGTYTDTLTVTVSPST